MVLNTFTVCAAVTPTVIGTYFSHYIHRKPLREKPTAHISYHSGLVLVRKFLLYASEHTVEETQAFTRQWVPVPRWVKADEVLIPEASLAKAAKSIQDQLGLRGIEQVGGNKWWQWRPDNVPLKAEWIEMRKDYNERMESGNGKAERNILYVHGGAYYFGSVDEHRYQMQRHARKLKGRVLAPRYRLAPQYPFPCGLLDCLATYLYMLEDHDPSTILFAGDSAGGGMCLSMLTILRDQGLPLPAGAILLSPWVDLTHSFPSLCGDGVLDFVPARGFMHKPSMAWPPPNSDEIALLEQALGKKVGPPHETEESVAPTYQLSVEQRIDAVRGYAISNHNGSPEAHNPVPSPHTNLSVVIDGDLVEIKDQIQMYAPNQLLNHPLVSPLLQPSLGGLPPLLIQVGNGELLRDEQIYVAHKAAAPMSYIPSIKHFPHMTDEELREQAVKYPPTDVQLQVWDDLCHVAQTLSWTRPAKFMYRAVAQFSAWALARAQKIPIDILDDDAVSVISRTTLSTKVSERKRKKQKKQKEKKRMERNSRLNRKASSWPSDESDPSPSKTDTSPTSPASPILIGRAGDPLPPFTSHIIRQRVDRHGNIHPLPIESELPALQLQPQDIGVIKQGPVRKWLAATQEFNKKFTTAKQNIQRLRLEEMKAGYEPFEGEIPPPTAVAGKRRTQGGAASEDKTKKSWGMSWWSGWGSKHDILTIKREIHANMTAEGISKPAKFKPSAHPPRPGHLIRQGTSYYSVSDEGQVSPPLPARSPKRLSSARPPSTSITPPRPISRAGATPEAASPHSERICVLPSLETDDTPGAGRGLSNTVEEANVPDTPTLIPESDTQTTRPTRGGIAYPFKLVVPGVDGKDLNPSMITLRSVDVGSFGPIGAEDMSSTPTVEGDNGSIVSNAASKGGLFSLAVPEASARDVNPSMVTLKSFDIGFAKPGEAEEGSARSSGEVDGEIEEGTGRPEKETDSEGEEFQRPKLERYFTAPEDLWRP